MYLGVKAKIVKSFARIHRANLVNFGILPLTFVNPADYDRIDQGDALEILDAAEALRSGAELLTVKNATKGLTFQVKAGLTRRQADIILAGGMLNFTRNQA
jgi:aconitate hydratase